MPSTSTLHLNGVMGPRRTIAAKASQVLVPSYIWTLPAQTRTATLATQTRTATLPEQTRTWTVEDWD